MKPDFMDRIAKIIEEVHNRTYLDKIDTEVLEYILQDALIEYHNEAYTYARNIGYDDGFNDGYDVGYDNGSYDGHSESHSAV